MAHKIVRIEMVEVGSGHGVKALIRDSRTGRKIAETDVRPFGFDAAVHSDALAEIEGRGWSWDGRGVVKDWEGNHSRPRSARRALPTHLFAAYDWTDSAGELAELGSLRGDSLAAYARAAEANARASPLRRIKAAAARVYGDPCAKEIESADLDDYRGQSPDDAIVAIVGGWSRAGTK